MIPAGNYFGELGALMGFPRSASARATNEVVAEAMGANEFRQGVEDGKY